MFKLFPRPRSITWQLLLTLSIPLFILVSAGAFYSALKTSRSVNQLYDEQLRNNAEVLLSFMLYETNESDEAGEFNHRNEQEDDDDDDEDEDNDNDSDELQEMVDDELLEIVSVIEGERGLPVNFRLKINNTTLFTSRAVRTFPACTNGLSQIEIKSAGTDNDDWHCYRTEQGSLVNQQSISVETFESASRRNAAIKAQIFAISTPLFILPLVVLLLAFWAVKKVMKHLRSVSHDIALRSVDNLERLTQHNQPTELLPVVSSVNQLLAGIERSLLREKQFTDDAAHELRTPITSINMLEQLLRRDNQDPKLNKHLDNLRASIEQSNALIEQLLSFARLQSAAGLNLEPVDVRELLRKQLDLLSPQITHKGLSISIDDTSYSGTNTVNAAAMQLLLNNLLSNAVKFSHRDGTITIRLSHSVLAIEDDGPGIAIQDRKRIFDRFFRGNQTQDKPGSGLGLALAKWVADCHGYTLSAEDPDNGFGARLVLNMTLPAHSDQTLTSY